jgi:hypothetical protein
MATAADSSGRIRAQIPAYDEAGEPLHPLEWSRQAPLEVTQRSPYSREQWLLRQAGRPIVAIDETSAGWALSTAAERWDAAVRRRRQSPI